MSLYVTVRWFNGIQRCTCIHNFLPGSFLPPLVACLVLRLYYRHFFLSGETARYLQKLTAPTFALWFQFWYIVGKNDLGSSVAKCKTLQRIAYNWSFLKVFCSIMINKSLFFVGQILCTNYSVCSWYFFNLTEAVVLDIAISACKEYTWNCSWVGPCIGGGRQGRGAKAWGDVRAAKGLEGTKGKW